MKHARIIGALIMREVVTRYGREGLGFLWLVAEPLLFCLGVLVMWSLVKPDYEYGVRIGAFVMTGYMCLLLLRHMISHTLGAIQANVGLLYHRQVTPLHVYAARCIMETAGGTIAFFIVYVILLILGQVSAPHDVLLLYYGWFVLALLASGIALVVSSLAQMYETVERITQLFTYVLIPLSGSFFMVSIIPPAFRNYFLLVPIPHTVEMVRAAVFGEFVETHYWPLYPLAWAIGLIFLGLILSSIARDRVEVD